MVRAGVVKHPLEWSDSGCQEFYVPKTKYCIINQQRLLQVLKIPTVEQFKEWHRLTLEEKLKKEALKRESFWSKAYAVGDADWVKQQLGDAGIKRMKIVESKELSYAIG